MHYVTLDYFRCVLIEFSLTILYNELNKDDATHLIF